MELIGSLNCGSIIVEMARCFPVRDAHST